MWITLLVENKQLLELQCDECPNCLMFWEFCIQLWHLKKKEILSDGWIKLHLKKKEGEKYKSVKYCMLISVGQLIRCYSNFITFLLTGREKVQFEIHQLQYSYKSLHYVNILGVDSFLTWMVQVSLSLCLWCSFSHSIHSSHIDNQPKDNYPVIFEKW